MNIYWSDNLVLHIQLVVLLWGRQYLLYLVFLNFFSVVVITYLTKGNLKGTKVKGYSSLSGVPRQQELCVASYIISAVRRQQEIVTS